MVYSESIRYIWSHLEGDIWAIRRSCFVCGRRSSPRTVKTQQVRCSLSQHALQLEWAQDFALGSGKLKKLGQWRGHSYPAVVATCWLQGCGAGMVSGAGVVLFNCNGRHSPAAAAGSLPLWFWDWATSCSRACLFLPVSWALFFRLSGASVISQVSFQLFFFLLK